MLKISENLNGEWLVIETDSGEVLAKEKTNSDAWRAVERLERRKAGRKSKLYQSNSATKIVGE